MRSGLLWFGLALGLDCPQAATLRALHSALRCLVLWLACGLFNPCSATWLLKTADFQFNGTAVASGTNLQLTTNGTLNSAATAWSTVPWSTTQSWTTSFTATMTTTGTQADGVGFGLQNVGTTALGNPGQSLGFNGLSNWVAFQFQSFWGNAGFGTPSTNPKALGTSVSGCSALTLTMTISYNVATTTLSASGNVVGCNVTTPISDTRVIDLYSTFGATVYAGFGGGTGGASATTTVTAWSYNFSSPLSTALAWRPSSATASSNYGAPYPVTLSFDGSDLSGSYVSGSTPTSTVDGFTNAGGTGEWLGAQNTTSGNIVYDMGQPLWMDRVYLFRANSGSSNNFGCLFVDVSNSSAFTTYTSVAASGDAYPSAISKLMFTQVVNGRYLRLRWNCLDSGPSTTYPGLDEIVVGGLAAGLGGVSNATWWSRGSSLGLADGAGISNWSNEANAVNSLSAGTTKPVMRNNNAQNINFNPVVEFTATTATLAAAQYFTASSMLGASAYSSANYVFVGYPTSSNQANAVLFEPAATPTGETNGELTLNLPWDNSNVYWNAGSYPTNQLGYSAARLVNAPSIYLLTEATSAQAIRQDGTVMISTTAARKTITGNNSTFRVGYGNSTSQQPFRGLMAEGALYLGTALSGTQASRIESYLAIKYGITLGGAGATTSSYLDAGGATVWASATGYHYNLAGVARDYASGLDQRTARSTANGSQITGTTAASMPSTASAISAQNGAAFSVDRSYVIWGDNNGSTATTFTVASGALAGRTIESHLWRLQVSGTAPTQLTLCIPAALITNGGGAGYLLVLASNAGFTTGTSSYALNSATCPGTGTGVTVATSGYAATIPMSALGALGGVGYLGIVLPIALDHLAITANAASGLTCTPTSFTITACADAACAGTYTGGLSGNLSLTGAAMTVNYPSGAGFTMASGSATASVSAQVTTVGSVTVSASGLSIAPANAQPVFCGLGMAAAQANSCSFAAADSGLLFNVPNHVAEAPQTVSVQAVKKSDNSLACTPAFASVSKSVSFKCSYTNPSTGTLPVRVAGAALNSGNSTAAACDAGGRAVSLSFDATGTASTSVVYADVGQITMTATYTGSGNDAGLTMTGSDSFIAAPAAFGFSAITAAPIKAGANFSATVSAQNTLGATTPNFGREASPEGATLAFTKRSPTGAGAVAGSFSGSLGSFSSGSATANTLSYTEVGTGDLSATLVSGNYLGTGLTATGSTGAAGAVGRFTPHHFDLSVTPGCSGSFTYAGQPFTVTVTARNLAGSTTLNYDGSASTTPNHAKAVTLSEPSALGVGTLSGTSLAASSFSAGVATSNSPSYSYTTKQTSTRTLSLRATDTDSVSSSGYTEGSTGLRSGRLRISNAFGSARANLLVPVTTEYWGGNAWVLNSADACTSVAAAAVALSNARNSLGNASAATTSAAALSLSGGQGSIVLAAPSPAGSSVSWDIALNLGSTTADQACVANHPASTGAAKAWLRSANGSCSAAWDRDPSGRVSFGIFAPETKKLVRWREMY